MKTIRSQRNEFTILELLIVVSIIVILAGLLLPALNKARETSQTVACTAKEKQLVTANAMYMSDFDEYIYPYFTDYYQQMWIRALEPYLGVSKLETNRYRFSSQGTANLFLCPGDTHTAGGKKDNSECTGESCGGLNTNKQSYGINFFFKKGDSPDRVGKKLNEMMVKDSSGNFTIKSGSATVYLTEVKWSGAQHYYTTSLGQMDLLRHGGRNNIAFLDGSVRAYVTAQWIALTGDMTYFDQQSFYTKILRK